MALLPVEKRQAIGSKYPIYTLGNPADKEGYRDYLEGFLVGKTTKDVDDKAQDVYILRGEDSKLFGVWTCYAIADDLDALLDEEYKGAVGMQYQGTEAIAGGKTVKNVEVFADKDNPPQFTESLPF